MRIPAVILVMLLASLPIAFCGFLFDYNLMVYFGKDIPWYADCLAGTLTSLVNVPAAVIALVLTSCDFQTPLICG